MKMEGGEEQENGDLGWSEGESGDAPSQIA